jgi:hypothetical protein
MREYTTYSSAPSRDEAPDNCQYGGCTSRPTHYVSFKNPKEYVCYCPEHTTEVRDICKYARASAEIR